MKIKPEHYIVVIATALLLAVYLFLLIKSPETIMAISLTAICIRMMVKS